MSYVYLARPETLSGPSSRFTEVPINTGFCGQAYFAGAGSGWAPPPGCAAGGAGGRLPVISATGHLPCSRLHGGFHDACERAAAADVAVKTPFRLLDGRVWMFLEERDRGHHETRS